ncbi:MAG: hypothetical protein ACRCYS_17255 [Beijerinckiaceae bacterium]
MSAQLTQPDATVSREWERVIGEAMAREALKAERDARRDIGAELWVWNAVKPSRSDHIPNCGDVAPPDPAKVADSLPQQVVAALCMAWRAGQSKQWRVSRGNAILLRPYGLCEAGQGVFLTNFGQAVLGEVKGGRK